MSFVEWMSRPWPWYVAGPLIGLVVPVLLIMGNKTFGVSSSLRHICAACFPSNIPFFSYNWKKEAWNLFFVSGIFAGGFITMIWLKDPHPIQLNHTLVNELQGYGIKDYAGLMPGDLFNWHLLSTVKGLMITVVGGFLFGFGTR